MIFNDCVEIKILYLRISRIIIELSGTSEISSAGIIALLIFIMIGQMVLEINEMWKDKVRRRAFDD